MPIAVPLLIGGATIGASLIGANAAKSASDQQAASANQALQFQEGVYGQNSANLNPWIQTGQGANNTLATLYGLPGGANGPNASQDFSAFTNSPDYNFAYQQGLKATDQSAAAKGLLTSGAQIRGAQTFGQGLASQQFGNYFNRMLSLSQYGLNAASSLAGNNNQSANSIGNSFGNIGQAQASGTVGGANAITGGIGSAVNNLSLYTALNKSPSSYGAGASTITPPQVGNYQGPAMGGGFLNGLTGM